MAEKGINWLLYIGGTPAAMGSERTSSLTISAGTIDITDKGDSQWMTLLDGLKTWSLEGEGLYIDDDTVGDEIEAAIIAGTALTVAFRDTNNNDARTGSCYCTNLTYNAPHDDAVSFSISLTGTGVMASATY